MRVTACEENLRISYPTLWRPARRRATQIASFPTTDQVGTVRRYLSQHLSGAADHSHRLWTLLTIEVWLRALPRWSAA